MPETTATTRVKADPLEALRFLRTLYGQDLPSYLNIWTAEDKRSRWFTDLHKAAQVGGNLATKHNVYFGLGLQAKDLGQNRRGDARTVVAIPGLWADVDVLGPAHKATNLPPTIDDALSLVAEFPLSPTLVVHSGHGLQVYWVFREPWQFESNEEREQAQDLARRFQATLKAKAMAHGWTIDSTADLARVLRPPGTINRKVVDGKALPLVAVRLMELHEDRRYSPSDFEPFLLQQEAPKASSGRLTLPVSDYQPADVALIGKACRWFQHCKDDVRTLPEPSWYAMLSILARCENGTGVAHAWSRPYPGYSKTETDAKLEHALNGAGPRTCKDIRKSLDGEPFCAKCKHWQKIESPITLGGKAPPIQASPSFRLWQHDELLKADFPEQRWIVDGLIPEGALVLLGGKKKLGKSWLALQMAQAVACGAPVLQKATTQGPVLYLCLEDGDRRLNGRLKRQKAIPGLPIHYITGRFKPLDDGGLETLEKGIEKLAPVLVIIDTLAAAKTGRTDENAAGDMGDLVNALRDLAQRHNVGIVLVAHHGKSSYGDPGHDLRGSSAIAAGADVNLGLYRTENGSSLKAEGRDIEDFELRIEFDAAITWCWQLVGDARHLARQEADAEVLAALEALGEAEAAAIAKELGKHRTSVLPVLKRLALVGAVDNHTIRDGRVSKVVYSKKEGNPPTPPPLPTPPTRPTPSTPWGVGVDGVDGVGRVGHIFDDSPTTSNCDAGLDDAAWDALLTSQGGEVEQSSVSSENPPVFVATADWQPFPEGAIAPNGLEFKANFQTGERLARLDPRAANPPQSHVVSGCTDALLNLAGALAWPRIQLDAGLAVAEGEEAWRLFAQWASTNDIEKATTALCSLSKELE